jgi:phospholipid/cholesterol/gamma-HCH transport system substrate-binding protein
MARRNIAEILTGAVILLIAAGFLAYAVAHSGRASAAGYSLHATFNNIAGLSVGSDVRLGGVKIGSITDQRINPETYLAEVTMTVDDGIKLPKDTGAEVTSDGLLGGKYLALSPGGDEAMLQPGGTITITQSAVSIEQLLGKFIFSATSITNAMQGGGGAGQEKPIQEKPAQDQPAPGKPALGGAVK